MRHPLLLPAALICLLFAFAASAWTQTQLTGTYDGQTIAGDILVPTSSTVTFVNGSTFTGSDATIQSNLIWNQNGSLDGKTLSFASGAILVGNGYTLTLGAGTTATGLLEIWSPAGSVINQGTIAPTSSVNPSRLHAPSFINEGAILAGSGVDLRIGDNDSQSFVNVAGGTITADGGRVSMRSLVNHGTLYATNAGILSFNADPATTADLGNIVLSNGGRFLINTTLDNSSATLSAPTGGKFELTHNAIIHNGTIAAGVVVLNGATLNNVIYTGDLVLGQSEGVVFTGGSTFTGDNLTLASPSGFVYSQTGTLSGKTITLGSSGSASTLSVGGNNNVLTLDSTTTVVGTVAIAPYVTATNSSVINRGTITNSDGNGELYASQFTNEGIINAASGVLNLGNDASGYAFTNAAGATINVASGALAFAHGHASTPMRNHGVINVASGGTLMAGASFVNETTGRIAGDGTINDDLILSGGVLAPGASIGVLNFWASDFLVTGVATLEIELGGGLADRLHFQQPGSDVNLGGGLLELSLSLLSAPAPGTTYDIITKSAGGDAITGYFNGVPTSGTFISADYMGTTYFFEILYSADAVSLQSAAIPEPSACAMLGGFGALVWVAYRRRRSIG